MDQCQHRFTNAHRHNLPFKQVCLLIHTGTIFHSNKCAWRRQLATLHQTINIRLAVAARAGTERIVRTSNNTQSRKSNRKFLYHNKVSHLASRFLKKEEEIFIEWYPLYTCSEINQELMSNLSNMESCSINLYRLSATGPPENISLSVTTKHITNILLI